jgi:GTP-dependent phosphoenolpyruvate carboxykinase
MNIKWESLLIKFSRILMTNDAPVWWDGFHDVIARNESSSEEDNPYLRCEGALFDEYQSGAKAAESLRRYIIKGDRQ